MADARLQKLEVIMTQPWIKISKFCVHINLDIPKRVFFGLNVISE